MENVIVMLDDDCSVRDALAEYLDEFFEENDMNVEYFSDLGEVKVYCNTNENAKNIKAGIIDLWVPENESDDSLLENGGRIALDEIRKKSPNAFGMVFSAHLDGDSINEFRSYNRIALVEKIASTSTVQRCLERGLEIA